MSNETNDGNGYKRYDLSTAIDNFAAVMEQNADRLSDAHKQVIANLTGRPFCAVKPIKTVYTTFAVPYFMIRTNNFTGDMMAALNELSIAHDIAYCKGVTTKDCYELNPDEMNEIVKAFRAAAEGRFYRPTWCPAYIDDIAKMKAFVFAYMTDINYHYERKILEEKGVEAFAQIAEQWPW